MKKKNALFFILVLLTLMPVLDVGGHFINLAEFYLYITFFLNLKNIRKSELVSPFLIYVVMFFLTTLLTGILAGEAINNYDIFVIRNMGQLIIGLILFHTFIDSYKQESSLEEQHITFTWCFAILTIPAIIVFFQSANFFNMRAIVQILYKPQFFFLKAEDFSGFRYTSVFKDFFTSAVYYTILSGGLFYYYLKSTFGLFKKIPLILLLLINYGAQFFVSRTSLVAIPILLLFVFVVGASGNFTARIKKIILPMLIVLPLSALFISLISKSNSVNLEWVSESLNFFSGSSGVASNSFVIMNIWIMNFVDYVRENPRILFVPNHVYDLTESANPFLYSDSFYPQEIYRYGVYGVISYLIFILSAFRLTSRKSRGLLLLILALAILNYKGGNTFFMPRNIYMYAFLFTLMSVVEKQTTVKAEPA